MYKFLVIFLLFIQTFFISVNAGEINCYAQNLYKHAEHISTQTTSQRKISIDLKNYENALITFGSKSQEIFAQRNSNNIDGYFIGFLNCDFVKNIRQNSAKQALEFVFNDTYFQLKNEINTRAP